MFETIEYAELIMKFVGVSIWLDVGIILFAILLPLIISYYILKIWNYLKLGADYHNEFGGGFYEAIHSKIIKAVGNDGWKILILWSLLIATADLLFVFALNFFWRYIPSLSNQRTVINLILSMALAIMVLIPAWGTYKLYKLGAIDIISRQFKGKPIQLQNWVSGVIVYGTILICYF